MSRFFVRSGVCRFIRREGCQIFADELSRFADRDGDARLAEISARVSAPLRVEVCGRRGVGVSTVASALGYPATGLVTAESGDVVVLVAAEVLKPEDLAELRGSGRPTVVVLNKADLAGSGPDGPLATAHRRAQRLQELAAVPVVPMVGLLAAAAAAALPAHLVHGLRLLAREPADLTSADAFAAGPHRLPPGERRELLERLDRFGIAHATLALSRGADAESLPGLLRRLSEVDRVLACIDEVAAPVRYRRVRWALAELRAVGGPSVGRFLAADDTVIAVMAAAVDVVRADGLTVDPGTDRRAHLCRARHWRRYRDGPVNALHRSCGDDIVRGSLRLLDTAGDPR